MMVRYLLIGFTLFLVVSCKSLILYTQLSGSLETVKKECPDICFYQSQDSAYFQFSKGTLLMADMDTLTPLPFEIYIPSGIIDYKIINSQWFEFLYKNNRIVVIKSRFREESRETGQQGELAFLPNEDISLWEGINFRPELALLLTRKNKGRVTRIYSKESILVALVNMRVEEVSKFKGFISSVTVTKK
jgi:hypothetical protein